MTKEDAKLTGTIFLLGAGASVDAGMPSVAKLTDELWRKLKDIKDINGNPRAEFAELAEEIASWDSSVRENYEALLEWIAQLRKVEMAPYRNGIKPRLDNHLKGVAGELAFVIKEPVLDILRERHRAQTYDPTYIANFDAFLPKQGRLDVFSLNYDFCVEDACRDIGIDVATGFSRPHGQWDPSVFRATSPGLNLYKLHGSLNWGMPPHIGARLQETWPTDWRQGEILLGPGSKLQYDDPFVTLYAEFHKAVRTAKACVIIGCRLADAHIKEPILDANQKGMAIIEVIPSVAGIHFQSHTRIQKTCKEAFESGKLSKILRASTLV